MTLKITSGLMVTPHSLPSMFGNFHAVSHQPKIHFFVRKAFEPNPIFRERTPNEKIYERVILMNLSQHCRKPAQQIHPHNTQSLNCLITPLFLYGQRSKNNPTITFLVGFKPSPKCSFSYNSALQQA